MQYLLQSLPIANFTHGKGPGQTLVTNSPPAIDDWNDLAVQEKAQELLVSQVEY
jgi:hypothetical protein